MKRLISLAVIVLTLFMAGSGLAVSPEVLEGAKKEGKVVLYLSLPAEEGKALLAAFSEKYPFIKPDFYRSPAFRLDEKFKTEARAGKVYADVLYIGLVVIDEYKKNGLVVPYRSPEFAGMFKDAVDPDGYWAAWKYITMGMVVNSKVVPKNLWPTDWTDFINPKPEWKGLLMTTDPTVASAAYMWVYGMKQKYGFETCKKIMEGIKKADGTAMLAFADGMTKVSTGERPILTDMMLEHHLLHKKKGAPIEYIIPKSGIIAYKPVGAIAKNAPHPNAAKLLIDYICSKEGQTFLARGLKNYPCRPDVELPTDTPELLPFSKINVIQVDEMAGEKEKEEMWQMWKKAMGR